MFAQINLTNFECYKDTRISFLNSKGVIKQNVLIFGNHDSGKSALIRSIRYLREITDALTFNQLLSHRLKTVHEHNVEFYNTTKQAVFHQNFDSTTGMHLMYEMHLRKSKYVYSIKFDREGMIVSECLIKKNGQVMTLMYEATQDNYMLGMGMVAKAHTERIDGLYKRYFGAYSFLSILQYGNSTMTLSIKKTIGEVLSFISSLHLRCEGYDHQERYNFLRDSYIQPQEGYMNSKGSQLTKVIASMINQISKPIFPQIDSMAFEITKEAPHRYLYQWKTYVKTNTTPKKVEIEQLSKSYRNFMLYTPVFVDIFFNYTVVMDDIDSFFDSRTVYRLFFQNFDHDGQVIMVLNSSEIMAHVESKYIYVIRGQGDGIKVQCIDEMINSRSNQNIRKLYEKEVYENLENALSNPSFPKYLRMFKRISNMITDLAEVKDQL